MNAIDHLLGSKARVGRYMHTAAGTKYWPFDPRRDEVDILTIAHHLANQCRYNGATQHPKHLDRIFYSVAEHSVYCSYIGPAEEALERLLHDASESYIGDLIRPLKYDESFRAPYLRVEELNEHVVAQRFGLVYPYPAGVKIADEAVTEAEVAQVIIRSPHEEWESGKLHDDKKVAPVEIQCFAPFAARKFFLHRFHQLWNQAGNIRRVPHITTSFGCYSL